MTAESAKPPASRRTFLACTWAAAAVPAAAALLGWDVVRIGHSECRTLLLRDNDPNRPPPEVTFEDRYTLTVGGQTLELAFHGPNHTPDNIFIWAPGQQTLMLVDVIFPRWVPFKQLAVSQDIPDWIKAQDVAMSYPWQTLVAGHNRPFGLHPAPGHPSCRVSLTVAGLLWRQASRADDEPPSVRMKNPNPERAAVLVAGQPVSAAERRSGPGDDADVAVPADGVGELGELGEPAALPRPPAGGQRRHERLPR